MKRPTPRSHRLREPTATVGLRGWDGSLSPSTNPGPGGRLKNEWASEGHGDDVTAEEELMANQPRRDNPARTVRVDDELWTADASRVSRCRRTEG